jgi:hypothetical protein
VISLRFAHAHRLVNGKINKKYPIHFVTYINPCFHYKNS